MSVLVLGERNDAAAERAGEGGFKIEWVCLGKDGQTVGALVDRARADGAAGLIAADHKTLEIAALARRELDLPGMGPSAARLLSDRALWRGRLSKCGVSQVAYRVVRSREEAAAAGENLGYPLYVVHAGEGMRQERAVEYAADLGLATGQVVKTEGTSSVVLESHAHGDLFSVYCFMCAGELRPGGVLAHETAPAPFRYPVGLSCPAKVAPALTEEMVCVCGAALEALEIDTGALRVDVMSTEHKLSIVHIEAAAAWSWAPVDLVELAGGPSCAENALRLAMGDAPVVGTPSSGAALQWLTTRSGEVTAIEGIEEALAVEGVVTLRVAAKVGDMMRHVIDPVSRDRVGYVTAVGPDAATAKARAERAAGFCRPVTRTML